MSSSSQGTRHRDAVSVTGLLLIRFQPQEWETLAWPALKGWNHFVAKPPLDEKELRSIFTSLADKEYEKYKI